MTPLKRSLLTLIPACLLVACGGETTPQTQAVEAVAASDQQVQQVVSYEAPGPAHVSDAKAGQSLAAQRRAETPIDPNSPGWQYPARVEPISWDYGQCTNARTLIPPPMAGWGLMNDMSVGEWPIDDDNASIVLTRSGTPHEPAALGHAAASVTASIYITSGRISDQSLADMLANPDLRDTFFEPGPYNYPVRKGAPGQTHFETLLGPYRVLMGGSEDHDRAYFQQMIKCAIDNGLIAEGVDAKSLRDVP
jgi:hypothetical protein